MKALTAPMQQLGEFEEILRKIRTNRGVLQVSGCIVPQKPHFISCAAEGYDCRLIITYSDLRARELYENYRFFDRDVLYFPAKDLIFFQADIHSNLLEQQRIAVLKALAERKNVTVITTMAACMNHLMPSEIWQKQVLTFAPGDVLDMEAMKSTLVQLGYERTAQAEGPGQFAIRGGILDVYPLTEENPVRIELWGDEIDSIRSFDAESQRSIENLEEIRIYPAAELIRDERQLTAAQLDVIQKYADGDAAKAPKLNKLGTQEWNRTKTRVRTAVRQIAQDLVKLYAERERKEGFTYSEDTVWQQEFEEMFPYDETEDQLMAIDAVKHDMQSRKIMDRLICGDVGYGKTEIAIRAAFKAVQDGKQVAYLVPTTILAQQHYNTFVQRMKDFPVRVDLMCRFRTSAEQKKTVTDLKKGMVDIVIGTHRLLSKDVEYKDLGLLIIDEEQRFGVAHKEKIKQLKTDIDVLTLTATPIPRTLHMSLVGIRDMSVLEEAPQERVPIQTYVMEYNEEMVREAISRELARGGQVYYVYNRVNSIVEITNRIAALVPQAQVAFAHGQMKEHELEKIMFDFINGDIDVLVTTTIIETGLDISNANTMIIHDADNMGLSQLYQLRGRVGRSNRTAYAFLMYRRNKMLKEIAEKRLAAIREFTELGSGFKIAMRDLELRGAGNLLGSEQHGHMEAVGYDLYCKLLNESVKEVQGISTVKEDYNTEIDLDIDAFIPERYIRNEMQKLDIYKRISGIQNEEEYDDMLEELMDRFGELPKAVQNLLLVSRLRAQAHDLYLTEVTQKGEEIRMVLYEKAQINTAGIDGLLKQYRGRLKFTIDKNPYFLYIRQKKGNREVDNVLDTVRDLLADMERLLG